MSLGPEPAARPSATAPIVAAAAAGWALVIMWAAALRPFRPFADEGSFCTIAQRILAGLSPYRDLFNEEAPLEYIVTAAFLAAFGDSMDTVRAVPAVTLGVISTLGVALAGRMSARLGVMMAWPLALLASGPAFQAFNNIAEAPIALLLLAAVWLHGCDPDAPPSTRHAALAGALLGLAVGFKQSALLPAVALALLRSTRLRLAAYSGGLIAGLAFWLGALAAQGILDDFAWAGLTFHWSNQGAASYLRAPYAQDWAGITLFALAFTGALVWTRGQPAQRGKLVVAAVAALPFLLRMDAFRLWPAYVLALSVLASAWIPRRDHGRTAAWGAGLICGVYLVFRPFGGWETFREYDAVVDHVVAHASAADTIWAGPHDPNVYCLAHRRPASRFYFILPWTATPEVRHELAAQLAFRPPAVIVDRGEWLGNPAAALAMVARDLAPLLAQDYREAARLPHTVIYVRKGRGEAP